MATRVREVWGQRIAREMRSALPGCLFLSTDQVEEPTTTSTQHDLDAQVEEEAKG
jgi:hypothetical protein